jgi:hypothetical protein
MASNNKIRLLEKEVIDGETWYKILCVNEVSAWLAKQGKAYYIGYHRIWLIHEMPESTYIMMKLVWSD